ncbi:LPXTG cell wall anchor domain-containing protein [Streptomyces kebangsaanensis]|uniref:LPXTG cell wall anchor domain-containing protein n=1 Tax=Streptomyces kebangsaanensis TaxID=864058 RepID=UPI00093F4833|nr:LPXTG cell wall anchor domain-containing protein [Streptomyces kebangsaanensis]
MKLRRAMAAAAATAVIAPLALLSAPAAFASEEPSKSSSLSTEETSSPEETKSPEETSSPEETKSPEETSSPEETKSPEETSSPEETKSPEETAPEETKSPEETAPEETKSPEETPTSPEETAPEETKPPEEEDEEEPVFCEDTKVDVSIKGLPGKIAAGSGWHKFTMNVANNSDSTLNDLGYFVGASADEYGEDVFKTKQVQVQAWNPDDKVWENLNDGGYAEGFVGYTDELKPDYEVTIPLRVNVKANAPVGAGFSFGVTVYPDSGADGECIGFGYASYKFQIVSAGTDTGGTKPQEGGKAPITDTKPDSTTPKVQGSLANTGSSSALPMIGLAAGAAVVAGAGSIVLVRRRKAGVIA